LFTKIILSKQHKDEGGHPPVILVNSKNRTNNRRYNQTNEPRNIKQYWLLTENIRHEHTGAPRDYQRYSHVVVVANACHEYNANRPSEEEDQSNSFLISSHASQYDVEHRSSPIHIECKLNVENQWKGKGIMDSLFNHIEKAFCAFK
jgi:hypothetical protein